MIHTFGCLEDYALISHFLILQRVNLEQSIGKTVFSLLSERQARIWMMLLLMLEKEGARRHEPVDERVHVYKQTSFRCSVDKGPDFISTTGALISTIAATVAV